MKYNKLVRDKIPGIIKKKGGNAVTHTATKKEYWQKLKEKLAEEVIEFFEGEDVQELADIMEVLDAIRIAKKIPVQELYSIQQSKRQERGGFRKRIILEES